MSAKASPAISSVASDTAESSQLPTNSKGPIYARPLKLATEYSKTGAPVIGARYGKAQNFVAAYRAYQWTQGYDVVEEGPSEFKSVLVCADREAIEGGCGFRITAYRTTFTTGSTAGRTGYGVGEPFCAKHDHDPLYEPLDLAQENERRVKLLHDDPALAHPPGLVRLPKKEMTLVEFLAPLGPPLSTEELIDALEKGSIPRDTSMEALFELARTAGMKFVVRTFCDALDDTKFAWLPVLIAGAVDRALKRREKDPTAPIDGRIDPEMERKARDAIMQAIAQAKGVKP